LKKLLPIVAFVIAFVIFSNLGRQGADIFSGRSGSVTDAQIEEAIASSPMAPMIGALDEYYPQDAERMRSEMRVVADGNFSSDEAFRHMALVGTEVRQSHARHLRQAPAQELQRIIELQIQMHVALRDEVDVCNRLVAVGPTGLNQNEAAPILDTAAQAASDMFRVMHAGETQPVGRSQASDQDWDNFFDAYLSSGGTETELSVFSSINTESPLLCDAAIRFLRVVANGGYEGSDRVLADFVASINGG